MKYTDIKKFPFASYHVTMPWVGIKQWLQSNNENIMQLNMDPFYQRGYVWSTEQKIAYIEYQLRGGFSGKDIFWNCPTWVSFDKSINVIELVDGKQRINAVLEFLADKIPVFGCFCSEFEGKLPWSEAYFTFHVNNLKITEEVVEWYVGMNTGGTAHTEKDLKPALDYLAQSKLLSDLFSIDEFIEYYKDATKAELRSRLISLQKKVKTTCIRNETDAINALLS